MKKKETFTLSRSFGLKRRFRPYKVLFLGAAGYKNAFIYPPAFFSSRSCKPNHRAARARKFRTQLLLSPRAKPILDCRATLAPVAAQQQLKRLGNAVVDGFIDFAGSGGDAFSS